MSGESKIEWTDATWNPTTGCTKVSPGCAHCYAESLTARYAGRPGWPAEFKPWTPANAAENVVLHPSRLKDPFKWKTPSRVFVNSMSDLFHEEIPDEFIDRVFAVMLMTPQHQYQVLTKRPARAREYLTDALTPWRIHSQRVHDITVPGYYPGRARWADGNGAVVFRPGTLDTAQVALPLPNVWLGVTVENQRWADERIPILLDTPVAVRFVSAEPLLGPVGLKHWLRPFYPVEDRGTCLECHGSGEVVACVDDMCHGLGECIHGSNAMCPECKGDGEWFLDERPEHLDWVIVGGESGPKHREFDPDWARSIVAQCKDAGVACFVKQLGGARPGNRLEDLPEDLRIREFPS